DDGAAVTAILRNSGKHNGSGAAALAGGNPGRGDGSGALAGAARSGGGDGQPSSRNYRGGAKERRDHARFSGGAPGRIHGGAVQYRGPAVGGRSYGTAQTYRAGA